MRLIKSLGFIIPYPLFKIIDVRNDNAHYQGNGVFVDDNDRDKRRKKSEN